jgi:DNA repair protein SbcC/Rad50
MKPLTIELQAFGPYRTKQVIDFTVLDELFVISGETGSGKTTIFDGLSYALYGEPLGTRNRETIRCDQSRDDEDTIVRFRFEVAGQVWEVMRSPHFRKENKRGTGFNAPTEFCELFRMGEDGNRHYITGGKRKITQYIENELLHLSFENFSKILVLPQGEFQKFLEEQSKQRGEILQKLFPVNIHQELMVRAKQQASQSEGEIRDLELLVLAQRGRLLGEMDETTVRGLTSKEFEEKVDELKRTKQSAIVSIKELETKALRITKTARVANEQGQQLQKKLNQRDKAKFRLAELNSQVDSITAAKEELQNARRATRATPALRAVEHLKGEVFATIKRHEQAKVEKQKTEEKKRELSPKHSAVKEHQLRLEAIAVEVERSNKRGEQMQELLKARAIVVAAKMAVKKSSDALLQKKTKQVQMETKLEELNIIQQRREKLSTSLNDARRKYNDLRQLSDSSAIVSKFELEQVPARTKVIAEERVELTRRQEKVVELQKQFVDARYRLDANAAGRLSLELQDGQPCPVCGSENHPNLAAQTQEGTDLDDLVESLELQRDAGKQSVNDYKEIISAREATFIEQKKNADSALHKLKSAGHESSKIFVAALLEIKGLYDNLIKQDQQFAGKLEHRPQLLLTQKEVRNAYEIAGEKNAELQSQYDAKKGVLTNQEKKLGGIKDLDAALGAEKNQKLNLEREQQTLQTKIKTITDSWERVLEALNKAKATVSNLSIQCTEFEEKLTMACKKLQEALLKNQFPDEDALHSALRSEEQEQALNQRVNRWNEEWHGVQELVKALELDIGEQQPPDLEVLAEQLHQAEEESKKQTEIRIGAENQLENFLGERSEYDALFSNYSKQSKDVQGLIELSKKLSGDNAKRVKFTNWVLAWWLDQVLFQANIRLKKLSESRYTFVRRALNRKLTMVSGLDINVIDSQSGQARDVRTLSGGEKFLASISLALGLADVIQMQSGAVRLDTLFIDEGFGTLSDEYRELVLQALSELRDSRQVGVISHVPEVKNYISCRVEISKSHGGSVVQTHI